MARLRHHWLGRGYTLNISRIHLPCRPQPPPARAPGLCPHLHPSLLPARSCPVTFLNHKSDPRRAAIKPLHGLPLSSAQKNGKKGTAFPAESGSRSRPWSVMTGRLRNRHRSGPGHRGCRGAESNSAVGRGGREASQSRRHCTGPRMLGRCLSRAGAQWEGLQAEGQLGKGGDAPTPGEGSGEAGRRGAE